MTSVVLPTDSEIVTPFSVSGVRPGSALVEPSRTLTEEYGVVVGTRWWTLLRGRLVF